MGVAATRCPARRTRPSKLLAQRYVRPSKSNVSGTPSQRAYRSVAPSHSTHFVRLRVPASAVQWTGRICAGRSDRAESCRFPPTMGSVRLGPRKPNVIQGPSDSAGCRDSFATVGPSIPSTAQRAARPGLDERLCNGHRPPGNGRRAYAGIATVRRNGARTRPRQSSGARSPVSGGTVAVRGADRSGSSVAEAEVALFADPEEYKPKNLNSRLHSRECHHIGGPSSPIRLHAIAPFGESRLELRVDESQKLSLSLDLQL